ncbi:MAG: hypothetical protein FJW31_24420 [Acidobacteria bacterium]|nr:hypothetical protein [Acidobacteriota bacterium]
MDQRVPFDSPSLDATVLRGALAGTGAGFEAVAVRWPALDTVDGEGLLLRPLDGATPRALIVALPDADWTPEQLAGLEPGVPPAQQYARRLAESGCLVLIPQLIDRADSYSGNPAVRFTNQPHREWIYRMAYQMGRHVIGYEVQKVMAAVDWFERLNPQLPVGVYGYGEGGLLALMAGALDERIRAVGVAGYFNRREDVAWSEPIYRNVWSQLEQFGDAELAALIAPRVLIVDASPHPRVDGPPAAREGRRGAAPGRIVTPPMEAVRSEVERARRYQARVQLVESASGPGGEAAMGLFLRELGAGALARAGATPQRMSMTPPRQERQVRQLVDFTQRLMQMSEHRRKEHFARLDASAPARLEATSAAYRREFWEESQGRMPAATEPLEKAVSREYTDRSDYRGYEMTIPVWGDVFADGLLLVPKNIAPGERRPVVVAQHGLEGRPSFLVDPLDEHNVRVYARFAEGLVKRGFIVFAPQSPYIGGDAFRVLLRKANPVKLSLFSFIVGQHSRILDWLATQPNVDPARIGFYGLSYGGKSALHIPAIETRYTVSVSSGNFNEWTWKMVSTDFPFTYPFTGEYEMFDFNLGHTFGHYEMAALIAPRPFMVERGHRDGVGIDEWVSLEYAKVRRLYNEMGIGTRTEIEYFPGVHQIHGVRTYEFLREWLGLK